MQGLVSGDNNRTPTIFQVPDIYRFVGKNTHFEAMKISVFTRTYQMFMVIRLGDHFSSIK